MAVVQKEIDRRERPKLMVGIWNMNYDHISWSLWWIFEYPNTTSVILGVIFSRNMDSSKILKMMKHQKDADGDVT